jgi:hypothetical protein
LTKGILFKKLIARLEDFNNKSGEIVLSKISLLILALVSSIFLYTNVTSQEVRVDGSLNLHSDFYNASGIDPRKPSSTTRGRLRVNVTLFDQINLPFEAMVSTQQSEFRQPFNQFGVSPQISDWLTLHGGYFNTDISKLTYGDTRLLGGGFELTPGDFQLKAIYGRSRTGTNPNQQLGILGKADQFLYSGSIGYGNKEGNFVSLNISHVIDDTNSIETDSAYFDPKENLTTSLSFGIKPLQGLRFNAEVALSAFSNNIYADTLADAPNIPEFLFTPRTSSQVDGAVLANLNIKPSKTWGLKLDTRWIGPGFVSLGYAQLPNDVFEISGKPTLRLMDNRLRFRAKAGFRYNNLRDNKLSTTRRFTGGLMGDMQITNHIGINARYDNNRIASRHERDSLKNDYRLNSISVSPRFNFQWLGARNNVNLSYNYKNSMSDNPQRKSSNKNVTNSINLTHSFFLSSQWNFSTNVFYSSSDFAQYTTNIFNISETVGKNLLNNNLRVSLTLGYSSTSVRNSSNDRINVRLRSSYKLDPYGQVMVNLSNNSFSGSRQQNPNYNEMQGSLEYQISF